MAGGVNGLKNTAPWDACVNTQRVRNGRARVFGAQAFDVGGVLEGTAEERGCEFVVVRSRKITRNIWIFDARTVSAGPRLDERQVVDRKAVFVDGDGERRCCDR